jgi:hypothetical protein
MVDFSQIYSLSDIINQVNENEMGGECGRL